MVIALKRRTVKAPEDRRRDILEAGLRLLAEKGVAATKVADIAAAAGVAKGTFYLYFDSKEQLVAALRERFIEESMAYASMMYARVGRDDWQALVDTVVEATVDFLLEHRHYIEIVGQEAMTPDVFDACERKLIHLLAAGIKAGSESGAFDVGDPLMTASMLHWALSGTVFQAVLYESDPPDRDRIVAAGKALARRALGAAA